MYTYIIRDGSLVENQIVGSELFFCQCSLLILSPALSYGTGGGQQLCIVCAILSDKQVSRWPLLYCHLRSSIASFLYSRQPLSILHADPDLSRPCEDVNADPYYSKCDKGPVESRIHTLN